MRKAGLVLALVFLLWGLVLTGGARANGKAPQASRPFYSELSWSPDGSRIIFSAFQGQNAEIYLMKADGSELTRLTDHPAVDMWAAMSPDGRRIAFQSNRDGSRGDLYVMNADGSALTRLTRDLVRSICPTWSPDGARIAFSSDRGAGLQLYVMKADGSEQARLMKNPLENTKHYNPVWSPDGKRLVFYSETGDHKDQIWVVGADGANPALLTKGVGHNVYPSWSRDGQSTLFTAERDGASGGIFVMKADGSEVKRLGNIVACSLARWSPDGKKIAFITGNYPTSEIYVMNADGSGAVKLTK
jgi:TolB protein